MMKKALTLMETLIVMVIIAIIAAITLPMFMANRPEKERTMYKKSIYTLQEALSSAWDDFVYSPSDANNGIVATGDNYWADVNAQTFCTSVAGAMNVLGTVTCNVAGDSNSPNFVTTNGVKWWGFGGAGAVAISRGVDKTIYIDVNGDSRPNQAGVDILKLNVRFDGKVITPASATVDATTGTDWSVENTYIGDFTKITK